MSTTAQPIRLEGKSYVIVSRKEYDRLVGLAKAERLPSKPRADADGNFPAVDYGRASLARNIIRDRVNLGMSQRDLASKAGVRIETLCRIERGKHAPNMRTLEKIDRVLKAAASKGKIPRRSKSKSG